MDKKEIYNLLSNSEIFQVNRLKAHSDHRYYSTKEEAEHEGCMSMRYSLNGKWQYHYAKNLDEAPIDFGVLDSKGLWDEIIVPSNIECEGKDNPHYTNVIYPWDGMVKLQPGQVPQLYNPTSTYKRTFTIPQCDGKPVYISFQGVESAFNLWINGEYVGYAEDTHTPSEFDITPFIREGENTIHVQVYKFCSGSWLESQDYWRLSGIFRDVYIYTVPTTHVYDMFVKNTLSEDMSSAQLCLDLELIGDTDSITAEIDLYDADDKMISQHKQMIDGNLAKITMDIDDVRLWSAENPYLYHMILTIKKSNGDTVEAIGQKVGFRKFEMKNGVMHINGKRIVFRGVNRHDFSTFNGRAVSKEEMEWDARCMKRNNMNAVRTSHYPNQSYWYELCDKYGIYVIDEANIETHGSLYYVIRKLEDKENLLLPDGKEEWLEAVIDRGTNMLERDKNHPSIMLWSCGNESHGGKNLYLLSEYFKQRDSSRLVHYEGITQDRRYDTTSDVESRMYAKVKAIKEYLDNDPKKPFVLCEYSHAMGNSIGGISKYIELEENYELYQGGFVWDYIDQCLTTTHCNGTEYLAYGGDFGDRPTDAHCIANGMVFADRTDKPDMYELKYAYQGFNIEPDADKVRIYNKNLFTNLNHYETVISLMRDGETIWHTIRYADIEPLTEGYIEYDLPHMAKKGEYVVTVSVKLSSDEIWAKQGHEVAFGQKVIKSIEVDEIVSIPQAKIVKCDNNIGVVGEGFHFMFAESNIVSMKYDDIQFIEVVRKGIRPCFWRGCTDNDRGRGMGNKLGLWKLATEYLSMTRTDAYEKDNSVYVEYDVVMPIIPDVKSTMTYIVNGNGDLRIILDYKGAKDTPDMPKFGVDFKIPMNYSNIEWYGMGPKHNYIDKNTWAKLGIFNTTVDEDYVPYTNPQEYGNKTGVRWAQLTNDQGEGLRIESVANPMEFSAIHYSPFELETALHPYELPKPYAINVTVCERQMGVGGDDSWGAPVLEEYLVHADCDRRLEFVISRI